MSWTYIQRVHLCVSCICMDRAMVVFAGDIWISICTADFCGCNYLCYSGGKYATQTIVYGREFSKEHTLWMGNSNCAPYYKFFLIFGGKNLSLFLVSIIFSQTRFISCGPKCQTKGKKNSFLENLKSPWKFSILLDASLSRFIGDNFFCF